MDWLHSAQMPAIASWSQIFHAKLELAICEGSWPDFDRNWQEGDEFNFKKRETYHGNVWHNLVNFISQIQTGNFFAGSTFGKK